MIITRSEYRERIDALAESINKENVNDIENVYRKDFLYTISTLNLFLGKNFKKNRTEFEMFFKEFVLYKSITLLDVETDIRLLNSFINVKGDLSIFDNIKEKPCIFCTFHYGAYQSIITYLTLREIDLFVIVPKEYLVKDIMSYEGQEHHADQKVNTILADNWSSLLELSNKLKEGKSIIILLDRLEGVNESSKEKLTKVNFLESELLVKKGIPEMSFLRKVPIVPVVCNRKSFFELDMEFFNPYLPLESENKKEYSNRVLQSIFSIFAKYTKLNPVQWEYWNEIYSRLDLTNINSSNSPQSKLSFTKKIMNLFRNRNLVKEPIVQNSIGEFCYFNKENYGIYKENDLYYLLNVNNFNCFKISLNLANILTVLSKEPIQWAKLRAVINPTLLEDLVAKKVLS